MKPESHAFRGIAIGLLMSVPLWMAIAVLSWNYAGLRNGTEHSRVAQIDNASRGSGPVVAGQETADRRAQ